MTSSRRAVIAPCRPQEPAKRRTPPLPVAPSPHFNEEVDSRLLKTHDTVREISLICLGPLENPSRMTRVPMPSFTFQPSRPGRGNDCRRS